MAKKQVLGKGLGAILPDAATDTPGETGIDTPIYRFESRGPSARRVLDVDLDQIRPNPHQPRDRFDEKKLAQLAASIAEHGLIQPVTVRMVGTRRFEIISGERRYRAARLAGHDSIPAYVRDADSEEMLEWALVENIQREDLDPIEQALGFQRLMEHCDLTQAQVAVKVGKDRSTVANAVRLLRLPAEVQAALRTGKISAGHARVLISIDDPIAQAALAERIVSEGMSVRATEAFAKSATASPEPVTRKERATTRLSVVESTQIRDLVNRLRSHYGTQVRIKHQSGKGGRIEIEYYSEEDLERVMELLLGME